MRSLNLEGPHRPQIRASQTDAERKLWFALRDRWLCVFKLVQHEAIVTLGR